MRPIVILLVLGACTSASVVDEGGIDPASPDPVIAVPAERLSVPWKLVGVDDATIVVQVMDGGCDRFERLEVAETDDAVHVVALARDGLAIAEREDPDGTYACTSDLRFHPADTRLSAPVGQRALVHEPIDPSWDDHPSVTAEWRGTELPPYPVS